MPETAITPENPRPNRDEVVAILKKLSDQGYGDPAQLDPENPEVKNVNAVLNLWSRHSKNQADNALRNGNLGAGLEYWLSWTTVYVDAGFHDPNYLYEVANDWLVKDHASAIESGLTTSALQIQAKIDEINQLILKLRSNN